MKLYFYLFLWGLLWHSTAVFAKDFLTLDDCYQLALKRSLEADASEENIVQAAARFTQLLGERLPRVNLNASELYQDKSGGAFGASFARRSQPQTSFSLTQPLFQGLKEAYSLKLSRSDRHLQEYILKDVKRLLYWDVARSFYTVLRFEKELNLLKQMLAVSQHRVAELRERVGLGRSRVGELVSQEADVSLWEAQIEDLKGQREVAYEIMSYLTGRYPHPLLQDHSKNVSLQPLEVYLGVVQERPDVKAAKERSEIALGRKGFARSDLLPKIDFRANYYPYRTGALEDVRWDMRVDLAAPLFDWNAVGKIREASSLHRQAEIIEQSRRRLSEREVREAYVGLKASRRKLSRYQDATGKAIEFYQLTVSDYNLGLVTNLDVLQAQKSWLEAARSRDETLIEERLQAINLKVTSGLAP